MSTWKSELIELRDVALPTALANTCEYLPAVLALSFVGHLSLPNTQLQLDAVALGRAFFNFAALSVGHGAISPLRTLFPQAIGASSAQESQAICALYTQRALVVTAIAFCVPCLLILAFAGQILNGLGQPQDVVELAKEFAFILAPSYFGWIGFAILQRFLQSHSRAYFVFFCDLVLAASSPGILYGFINKLDLQYLGAAYSSILCSFIPLIILIPYIYYIDMGYIFKPRSLKEIFDWNGMYQYFALGIPGFLQINLEWWVLESVSILAGILPNSKIAIAASYICLNLETITVMAWISIMNYNSVRVGYFIGSKDIASAKRAAQVGFIATASLSSLVAIFFYFFRYELANLYSNDPEVLELTSKCLVVAAFVVPMDGLKNCVGGIMGGLGLQKQAAIAQFVGYYVIGMPIGCLCAFLLNTPSIEPLLWLWVGVALAMASAFVIQLIMIMRFDWSIAIDEAMERLLQDEKAIHSINSQE